MEETSTELINVKVPFTTYDIFGYLIPGSTFLLNLFLFELWISKDSIGSATLILPIYKFLSLSYPRNLGDNWVIYFGYIFFLLILSYVLGHIISSISSFALDRIIVLKGYGYPYETLLKIPSHNAPKNPYSRPFYRGMLFWINSYLLVRYFSVVGNFHVDTHDSLKSLADILGWFIVVVFSVKIIHAYLFHIFNSKFPKALAWLSKYRFFRLPMTFLDYFFINFFPAFYNLISNLVAGFIRTRVIFSEESIGKYNQYFSKQFKRDCYSANNDNFWYCYYYVLRNCPILARMLLTLFQMTSFTRNLTMSFYLSFFYCFIFIILQFGESSYALNEFVFIMPLIMFVLSILFLIRFYYVYFSNYNKFIFRAFLFLNESQQT